MDNKIILKAEIFDLSIELSRIQKMMKEKINKLNTLNIEEEKIKEKE